MLLPPTKSVTADDVRLVLPADDPNGTSASSVRTASGQGTLVERTEAFEREVLLSEIRRHNFHMTNVARTLGLERSHLYKKCQQHGIDLSVAQARVIEDYRLNVVPAKKFPRIKSISHK